MCRLSRNIDVKNAAGVGWTSLVHVRSFGPKKAQQKVIQTNIPTNSVPIVEICTQNG